MLLHVYYGKEPTIFTYYVDDGVSYEYEKGVYFKRQISFNPSKNEINIGEKVGSLTGKFTKVKLILHGFPAVTAITVNGTGVSVIKESEKVQSITFGRSDKETVIRW
jgi:alpha-glucosidase